MKEAIAAITVAITFLNYIPYIIDTLRNRTRPHIYSWFLWAMMSFIVFALQLTYGAGPGAIPTLGVGILCFFIAILAYRQGNKYITKTDTLVLIITLISIATWVLAKQPVTSTVFVTVAEALSYWPTLRKSWYKPRSETLSLYVGGVIRTILAIAAIESYNFVTLFNQVVGGFICLLFVMILVIRRRQITYAASA